VRSDDAIRANRANRLGRRPTGSQGRLHRHVVWRDKDGGRCRGRHERYGGRDPVGPRHPSDVAGLAGVDGCPLRRASGAALGSSAIAFEKGPRHGLVGPVHAGRGRHLPGLGAPRDRDGRSGDTVPAGLRPATDRVYGPSHAGGLPWCGPRRDDQRAPGIAPPGGIFPDAGR
jgi:hypothetical protein